MHRWYRTDVALAVIVALCSTASASAIPLYRITDLGHTRAAGINSSGQVALSGGSSRLWTPTSPNAPTGTFTSLPEIAPYRSWTAIAINDSGQITGNGGDGQSVVWDPNQPNTLNIITPPLLPDNASMVFSVRAINNLGQIAGYTRVAEAQHATLWSPTIPGIATYTAYDLGATIVPGHNSVGYAINNAGQIAGYNYVLTPGGYYAPRASVWTPDTLNGTTGTFRTLAPPAPDNSATDYSYATAINDAGDAVGYAKLDVNGFIQSHAILWPAGSTSFVDLGAPPTGMATAINSLDHVVGYASFPNGQHAFLWTPSTGMVDLNSLVDPADQGWTLSFAGGINAAGQIIATGTDPSGHTRAVLLTPVPEPVTLLSTLAGITFLLHRRRA